MAPRWGGLRPEPYDPDARDADGDGIVQEQTAWERPVGTNLVDELGRAITRGSNVGARPRGMRVVDSSGNDVDYTPTYARPGAAPGTERVGGTTALADHGAGSLKERGLPTVRAAAAPRVPEPEVAPEKPETSLQTKGRSREEIEAKSAEIRQRLKSIGAATGRQDAAYKERVSITGHYRPYTVEEVTEERTEVVKETIADLRAILSGDEEGRRMTPDGLYERVDFQELKRFTKDIDPATADLILNSTDEELEAIIAEQAMVIHKSFLRDNIQMCMPAGRLDTLLDDGTFRNTHEVDSDHSGAEVRSMYEVSRMGLPLDAPADLRPIHGWLSMQDHLDGGDEFFEKYQRESEAQDPRLSIDWAGEEFAAGPVESVYGGVRVTLRPGMEGRTSYTMGDSVRANPRGVLWLDETDEDVITNQMIMGRDMVDPLERVVRLLDQKQTGNTRDFLQQGVYEGQSSKDKITARRTYWETQVYGGIQLEDIAEVSIPIEDIATTDFMAAARRKENPELRDKVTEEFFGAEKLRSLGLSEEEIAWLQSNWDKTDGPINAAATMRMIRDHRRRQELNDRFQEYGVKVNFTSPVALDLMDPASYRGAKPGQSIEEVLNDRLYGSIAEETRKAIQSEAERAARLAAMAEGDDIGQAM